MTLRSMVILSSLSACSGKPAAGVDAAADAAPDAACQSTAVAVPVTVTGTSPGGPLDNLHYATASFLGGDCADSYLIDVTPTELSAGCTNASWLQLVIHSPFVMTGTNTATATLMNATGATTDNVTFEATQLDLPAAMPPHIVGHFVSHDAAWSFDIAVDLTSQSANYCI